MQIYKKFFHQYWGLFFVLGISILTILPLFIPGFFPIHDNTQVARIYEMGKSLQDGMFPVRWVNDLGYGYGYPIFNFYAPLAYYFGGLMTLVGVSALLSTKIIFAFAMLLAGVSMYTLGKSLWGNTAGIFSGLLYEFATYHAVNIYVRGDLAELFAYGLIPLVFLGVLNIHKKTNTIWNWTIFTGISFAAIITSHNLTAMMVTPFLLLFSLIYIIQSQNKLYVFYFNVLAVCIGVLLSAFYWLPSLLEIQYTNVLSQIGGGANFKDHFVCLQQLWYSPWGYGGSAKGCVDGFSFALGKVYLALVGISIIGVLLYWKKIQQKTIIAFAFFCVFASIFLQTQYSQSIWEAIRVMAFFQYPWRFLALTGFSVALLGGLFVQIVGLICKKKSISKICIAVVIFVLLFFQVKLFVPQTIFQAQSQDFTNSSIIQWATSKISDEYLPKNFSKPKSPTEVPHSIFYVSPKLGGILAQSSQMQRKQAQIILQQEGLVTINLAYFPSWHAYIDGVNVPVIGTHKGMEIDLPKGVHTLTLKFESTSTETLGNILTLTGILICIIGIIKSKKCFVYGTSSS